jgi:hypothetical protein
MAALFFWAPSALPARAVAIGPCGFGPYAWLSADTAFAGVYVPPPCPITHALTPWAVIAAGASATSVILNAIIVSNSQCRELTRQEALSSNLLPFIGIAFNQHNNKCPH